MLGFSATVRDGTFDVWLYDDNGDPYDPSVWTDLLEGASTVTVEWATAPVAGDDTVRPPIKPQPQGPWQAFTVDLLRPQGYAKRVLRRNLTGVPRDREYILQFSIDGGPWLGPISILWTA